MRVWSLLFVSVPVALAVMVGACGNSKSGPGSTFEAGMPDSSVTDTGMMTAGDVMSFGDVMQHDACVPVTCQQLGYECGPASDHCGGLLQCGTCETGTCGGGGKNFQCGGETISDAGLEACAPRSCQDQGQTCGPAGDGCGNLLQCGTCEAGSQCEGIPSTCMALPPGAETPICVPKTCQEQGYNCGPAGDGCGNMLDCGMCTAPETCGGGGFNLCGGGGMGEAGPPPDSGICVPRTCGELGYTCGFAGDGCGGVLQCGTCTAPQTCGGGGTPYQCGGSGVGTTDGGDGGTPICTPITCAQGGYGCGEQGDGCGGVLQCGTCPAGETCGSATVHNQCVSSTGTCTNLCLKQTSCDVGLTSITGKVIAATPPQFGPADPVPNVIVYVPNSPVLPFTQGVACNQCGADITGDPLVQTVTADDGTFQLNNVPIVENMPIVIQLGRWRRQFTLGQGALIGGPSIPSSCTNTSIGNLVMPADHTQGDIPLTAISTGNVDALECVVYKMGVSATEFTLPANPSGGSGRIQMFVGNGSNEGFGNPLETALTTSPSNLSQYDEVLFPCWGDDPTLPGSVNVKTPAEQQNIISYANMGGRLFIDHYSFAWLYNDPPFSMTATWLPDQSMHPSVEALIDTSLPITQTFDNWMTYIGAAVPNTTPPQLNVLNPFHDFNSVVAPAVRWIYTPDYETFPLQYTFDTPYNAANVCGRVIFSDFHVVFNSNTGGSQFPHECNTQNCTAQTPCPMSPQEKALEYLLWSLDVCVPGPAICVPETCSQQNIACGPAGDGCGNVINCGACPEAGPICTPETCAQQNIACGPAGDGCGNEIQCGTCPAGETCGGPGVFGQCVPIPEGGTSDSSMPCKPETCSQQGIGCGPAADGCGNELMCGMCTPPQTCGGGGVNGECGSPPDSSTPICIATTCMKLGYNCGPAGNGCGGQLNCGMCTPPQTCGGGGMASNCGAPPDGSICMPETCLQQNIGCGPAGDGCGNLLNCGTCVTPETCGGGGTPGQCGGSGNN